MPEDLKSVAAGIDETFNDGRKLGSATLTKFSNDGKFHHLYALTRNAAITLVEVWAMG